MDFYGKGNNNSNAQGWMRSSTAYFEALKEKYPQAFSKDNLDRISEGWNPVIDDEFLNFLPKPYREMYAKYKKQPLIHHHAGEGGQAFAVPAGVHVGVGGVHNAEKHFGIIANAEIQSLKIRQAFEAGFITAGNDVWKSLKSDSKYDDYVINGISDSETKYEFIQELKTDKEILDLFDEFKNHGMYNIEYHEIPVPEMEKDDIDPEENITSIEATAETISEIKSSKEKLFLVKILCYILSKDLNPQNSFSKNLS